MEESIAFISCGSVVCRFVHVVTVKGSMQAGHARALQRALVFLDGGRPASWRCEFLHPELDYVSIFVFKALWFRACVCVCVCFRIFMFMCLTCCALPEVCSNSRATPNGGGVRVREVSF